MVARRGFTLLEVMITVAIIGVLAAAAFPNYVRMQQRSKQSEAQVNLRAFWASEKSYLAAKDTYVSTFADSGFTPERGNRYVYWDAGARVCQARSDTSPPTTMAAGANCVEVDTFKYPTATAQPYPTGNLNFALCTTNACVAQAAGVIGTTTAVDGWSISLTDRVAGSSSSATACLGGVNPAGEPCNDYDGTNFFQ